MAKKALINKQRPAKFGVRAYTRCGRCGRARAVYRKFLLCRSASVSWRTRASSGGDQGLMVTKALVNTDVTDPVADLLTRIRNANSRTRTISRPRRRS